MLEAGGGINQEPMVNSTGEKPSIGGLSSIVRKSLPKGKSLTHKKKPTSKTPSLTGEGKQLARTLFEEAKSSLGTEAIQDETKAVRKEINDFLSSTKKIVRGELRAKWKEEGKKLRGNSQQFKEELERQMQQDEYVQDARIQRKLLTSIKQIARLEQTKEERERVRNYLLQHGEIEQITKNGKQTFRISQNETELTSFKTERFKTKIPYDPLIINAFISHRLKEEKEKPQISEVKELIIQEPIPSAQPQLEVQQAKQQEPPLQTPEDEVQKTIAEVRRMQNERAERLKTIALQRKAEKEKQIAQRLGSLLARTTKNLTHEVKAVLDQIKQKPMQAAMATLMVTTIGATALGILKEGPAVRTAFAEGTNAIAAMVTPTRVPVVSQIVPAEKITPPLLQTEVLAAPLEIVDMPKIEESTVKQKINELTAEYPGIEGARKLKVPTAEEFSKEVVSGKIPAIEYPSVIGEFDYMSYFAIQPKEIREKLMDSYAEGVVVALEKTYGSKSLLILVEPGHRSMPVGGKGTIDTGTGSAGMREKDVNVEISKRIAKRVAERNQWIAVVSGDYETEKISSDGTALNSREALGPLISGWQKLNDAAKKDNEVIKISVHMNGSSVPNARNGEVYYQTVGQNASEEEKLNESKSQEFAKILAASLEEKTKKVIPDYSARTIGDNPNDQYITLKGDKKFKEFFTSNLQSIKSRFASVLTSNKT
ncbi:hypothetical protein C4559_01695 [Candidatus Microgenomates bacterium]|nr:MAG: hypothetical protein C4559_01695 [Candidatus Microgenomates bacterium]